MANTLVVDTSVQEQSSENDFSVVGYRSVLPASTIIDADEDPDFPFINVTDFRDNTKYSPLASSGSVVIEFRQGSAVVLDYFAFAIHNSQEALLTGTLEIDSGSGFETIVEFASIKSNRPFLSFFDSKTTIKQRLTLNFTSKLFIGSINLGKAFVLERTPSLGFQPGRFAPLDEVEQFTTDGNNFIVGRRINRGFQTKGAFRFINFDTIETEWEEYQNHVLDSKPVYFKWSKFKDQTSYALQNVRTLARPTYINSFFSDITFEFNGYA